jgi:hypothetical protein
MHKSFPGCLVEFLAQKMKFSFLFLSLFASKLDFKTWFEVVIIAWNSVMLPEEETVDIVSSPEEQGS